MRDNAALPFVGREAGAEGGGEPGRPVSSVRRSAMAATETGQIEGVRIRECQGRADGMSVMRWDAYRASDSEWFAGYADVLCGSMRKGAVWPFHYHKEGIDTFG
jgi:hypothetical protein